jgi:hypothetical protein
MGMSLVLFGAPPASPPASSLQRHTQSPITTVTMGVGHPFITLRVFEIFQLKLRSS